MYITFNIEDLAANALIYLKEKKNTNKVSFKQLLAYRNSLIHALSNEEIEDFSIELSQSDTDRLCIYSTFFNFERKEDSLYIYLREEKTTDDLRDHFRAYLPSKITKIFYERDVYNSLNI